MAFTNLADLAVYQLELFLRQLEEWELKDSMGWKKQLRMELFKRGVDNINGTPLEVLLRNPLLRAEYEEARGINNETGN